MLDEVRSHAHETRVRPGQEAHAAHCIPYEAMKHGINAGLPIEAEFMARLQSEVSRLNDYVATCLAAMVTSEDASSEELVRCSGACGSLNLFIVRNREGVRKIAKAFDEKARSATERRTQAQAQAQQLLTTAAFCNHSLEVTLDLQLELERWASARPAGVRLPRPNLALLCTLAESRLS